MRSQDFLVIGGLCIAGYFLWKQLGGTFPDLDGGGGGGGLGETGNDGPVLPFNLTVPGYTITPPGGGSRIYVPLPINTIANPATVPAQAWTGVTYGQPGQPSTRFLANTMIEASKPNAPQETKMAAAAAYAGAPPRVVAKIKAGKIY